MKRRIPFMIAALIFALGLISCSNQVNITSGPYVIPTAGGKGLRYGKDPAGGSPGRAGKLDTGISGRGYFGESPSKISPALS